MNHHVKNPLRRYWIQSSILFAAYLAIVIYLMFFHTAVWSGMICILLYFPVGYAVRFIADRNFIGILDNELDAQKFYDTIYYKPMRLSTIYRLNAEWYTGNYEKLIILAAAEFKTTKNLPMKCICLSYLARAYFELRDIENLKKTVHVFDELQRDNPKNEKLFSRCSIFSYYKAYIDKDFEQCLSLSEERIKTVQTNRFGGKLQLLSQKSFSAVAYYELGNFNEAKEIFEYLLQTAPKLKNFNHLATKYLSAIENQDDTVLSPVVYQVDTTEYEQKLLLTRRKRKINVLILLIGVVLVLGSLIMQEYTEWKQEQAYKDAIVRYENKLNAALSRRYQPDEQAKFLVYFDVDYNGQNIDTLCIVATVNGLDLVSVVTSDGGKTLDTIVLDSHIDISKPHLIKSVVSNYYIGYRIYTTPINKDDFYNVIEFTYDNQKYLLGIDYVDITPKD